MDAIVNITNPYHVIADGVDIVIHRSAGPELLVAWQKIGAIDVGQAVLQSACLAFPLMTKVSIILY